MTPIDHPPVLFQGTNSDPVSLREVIGQAIGVGSTNWENLDGTGVYNSERAIKVVEEAVAWIEERYTRKADKPRFAKSLEADATIRIDGELFPYHVDATIKVDDMVDHRSMVTVWIGVQVDGPVKLIPARHIEPEEEIPS